MTIYTSDIPDLALPCMNAFEFVVSNPNKVEDSFPILTDAATDQVITFGEFRKDTRRWATGLESIGFRCGDVLALFSFNQIDYPVALFGPLVLGGSTTTANSAYNAQELAYQLKDSSASVMIAHPDLLSVATEAAEAVSLPMENIFLFGDKVVQGFKPYRSIMPPISVPESELAQSVDLSGDLAAETTAIICYSSGTTGRSKGVELSHYNYTSNCLQTAACDTSRPSTETPTLSVLPMFHIYSLLFHLMCGIYTGTPTIVQQKFVFEDFLRAIQDHKICALNLVPPQLLLMVKSPLADKYDLSSLRLITVGAAPTSRELIEGFLQKYPLAKFRQVYGMSELAPTSHLGDFANMVHGSAGRVVPNMQVRVVDPETGLDVKPGQPGEVWSRGPNAMKGYRNNPQATRDLIDENGWVHSGDIAVVDENRNFFIVDRLKELIKYKGSQVAPAELEALLLTHPLIADAAVIGVEDSERGTEVPMAFVVVKNASGQQRALTEKDVVDFVASKVANYKRLRGGVCFVDSVPKSPSGKILRRQLRVLVQAGSVVAAGASQSQSPILARL